jgi:hypothetical protein
MRKIILPFLKKDKERSGGKNNRTSQRCIWNKIAKKSLLESQTFQWMEEPPGYRL